MYRDVMSMVKISLSWPEKLKSRKICSACVLSLMYDGKESSEAISSRKELKSTRLRCNVHGENKFVLAGKIENL